MKQLDSNVASLDLSLTTDQIGLHDKLSKPRLDFPADFLTTAAMLFSGGVSVDGVAGTSSPPCCRDTLKTITSVEACFTEDFFMQHTSAILASFKTDDEAKACVRGLSKGQFTTSINAIAWNPRPQESVVSLLEFGDSIPRWTLWGTIGGALFGLLFDTALSPPSQIGSLDLTGALASWIFAIVEWSLIAGLFGAIIGSLVLWSRRRAHKLRYQITRQSGRLLLIAFGTPSAHAQARLDRKVLSHELKYDAPSYPPAKVFVGTL